MLLMELMKVRFRMLDSLVVVVCGMFNVGFVPIPTAPTPIANPESYFSAPIGSVWHYQGTEHKREVQLTATNIAVYMNSATAVKTMQKDGQRVIVFIETNPSNRGERESYYHVGDEGVIYHGSHPHDLFEQQLTPYPVVRFPLLEQQTLRQFNLKDGDLFQDIDGDGINEHVDAFAEITVGSLETLSVLAGTFQNVLRLNGKMELTVTMSSNGEVIVTKDKLISWFAPHVGLIKSIETVNMPVIGGVTMHTTVVTEELEEFRIAEFSMGPHISPPTIFDPVVNFSVKQ
ncbi:MAG: hypothetical protein CMH81_05810 [Nitrospiraceae bacterium]|nr:hypothetical protein [Nitrospiraceae bacterium]|tara:strand:- start:2378 stop:3241 length:864 start_codon:yes stop_codon:yes gene_type:complete